MATGKIETKKQFLYETSSTVLTTAIHEWMSNFRNDVATGESQAVTCSIIGTTRRFGIALRATNAVCFGILFNPNLTSGFIFRDSSDESAATYTNFDLAN